MAEQQHSTTRLAIIPSNAAQSAANLRGIIFIMIGMGAFVFNDTLIKTVSAELPVGQILAIRGFFSCLFMAPIVALTVKLAQIRYCYSVPLAIRNISEIAAAILYLNALFRLPIANVTAILQTLPLTMTAAAAILLKEPVGLHRWSAAAIGLLCILLVIRPGSADFSWWYILAILCVLFVTVRDITTRFINASVPSTLLTLITAFAVMITGCVLGFFETWALPSLPAIAKLATAAVLVLVGYYSLIECWRGAEISVVAPFRYSVVLWSICFGYLLLGETPSLWTLAGSAIVVAAGIYTLHREQRTHQ